MYLALYTYCYDVDQYMINILLHIPRVFFLLHSVSESLTACIHPHSFCSCLLENLTIWYAISLHPFMCSKRKQDYLSPGKTYAREPARCLCCPSNPLQECGSARMTGSLPNTWAPPPAPNPRWALSPLTAHLCPSLTPSPSPHHSPAAGRTLGFQL